MTISEDASILSVGGRTPQVDPTVLVAAGARVVGDVHLAAGSSVWYNAVLRAEAEAIAIGPGSNIQDGVAVHVDAGFPVTVGENVSVGHNAVLHGCTVEDGALIGMGAVVLNGAVVGAGSLVAAGALVLAGTVVPPGSLVAGVPAKVRRSLGDDERAGIVANASAYLSLREVHESAEVFHGTDD